jgi:hypothetical protein
VADGVQLVVVKGRTSTRWTEANLKPDDVVWVRDEEGVRHLLEHGICKWPEVAPQNTKPAGPSEVKEEPEARKRSGEAMAGRTIASPSSSEPGAAKLSSASAAALLPPQRL